MQKEPAKGACADHDRSRAGASLKISARWKSQTCIKFSRKSRFFECCEICHSTFRKNDYAKQLEKYKSKISHIEYQYHVERISGDRFNMWKGKVGKLLN